MPKQVSKFIGVYWSTRNQKWDARITINGKIIHCGNFEDDRDAAKAYDREAIKVGRETNILKPLVK